MPCSGMLNEFRVHFCYGSWLNGHRFAFSVTCSLNGDSQNVKMWRYCPVLMSHGTSNTSRGRLRRKWITVWLRSEVLVSALTASAQTQSWATCWRLVAKQYWKTLICIIAPLSHAKQKFLRKKRLLIWLWMFVPVEGDFMPLCFKNHHIRMDC